MLVKVLVGIIVLGIGMLVLTVVLFMQFGWWAVPILFVLNIAFGFVMKKLATRVIRELFLTPFKLKGAALKGATATVHSVEPAPAPPRDPEDSDDEPERAYYLVDVTIAPGGTAPADGKGFTFWEPGEIVFVDATKPPAPDPENDEDVGEIERLEVWSENAFREDEDYKYEGPQRLRLHVGVDPSVRRVRFKYYFEHFGEIALPKG
jgi:hypothetical protein